MIPLTLIKIIHQNLTRTFSIFEKGSSVHNWTIAGIWTKVCFLFFNRGQIAADLKLNETILEKKKELKMLKR